MRKLIIIAISIALMGCPGRGDFEPDVNILIRNNSNDGIVEYRNYSELNDTTLQTFSPFVSEEIIGSGTIEPSGELNIPEESERIIRFGAIHIFLLNKDTLLNVPWERIRDENLVLKRYDLTLEDLERRDWRIEYPE